MDLSLPIHLQNAGRCPREGCTHSDVGLQSGLSEDHATLQESEAHQGMYFSRESLFFIKLTPHT